MNLKSGVFIFLAFFLIVSFVSAAENETTESRIVSAYACLQNGINNKTVSSLSLQESLFGVMALGNNARAVQKLDSENRSVSNNQTCWPRASCTLKETAQALLAYRALGRNEDKIENWLLSRSGATTGLRWFLEIDSENHVPTTCHVRYGSVDRVVSIGSDMKLTGDLSSTCLSIVPSGYWLEIASSCLDRSYEVSCDQDFLTTLLYQQSDSETLFVSPNTQSKPAGGTTNESISSRCFKSSSGSECDYEGTLWATVALDATGANTARYIPYLAAFAPSNERYLPSSFLYKLTGGQDHYTSLIQEQRNNQYWEAPSSTYRRFYDTSLALWALQGTSAAEITSTKDYLLEVQNPSGCWDNNNLRSTAFILYAAWPDVRPGGGPGGSGGTPTTTIESCLGASPSYSCVESLLQCADAGGEELRNYDCTGALFCCSVTPRAPTCTELNGELCSLNEECSGTPRDSSEGQCCLGSCTPITDPTTTECEDNGGSCSASCSTGETQENYLCSSFSEVCCVSDQSSSSGGSKTWIWVVVLIILIALVTLGIIYRRKIQMFIFKNRKTGQSSSASPIMIRRPPFPPSSPGRPLPTTRPQPQARRPVSQVDKDMEETLRKLREMSK